MHFTVGFDVEPSAGIELSLDGLRRHLTLRVAAAPWLRRKVKRAAGGFGPMLWVDDPRFSIDRHVLPSPPHITGLPVNEALTVLTTEQLPRDRPLWQLFLHPAKQGEPTTLFLSMHHALSDGGLLQSTLNVLFGVDAPAVAPTRRSLLRKAANSTAAVTAYAVAARVSDRLRAGG